MIIKFDKEKFDFDSSTIEMMSELIKHSGDDGRERGFNFFESESGKILPGISCVGEGYSVSLHSCLRDDILANKGRNVGSFHTHIWSDQFSDPDYTHELVQAYEHREVKYKQHKKDSLFRRIMCIGLVNGDVKCTALENSPERFKAYMGKTHKELNKEELVNKLIETLFSNPVEFKIKD